MTRSFDLDLDLLDVRAVARMLGLSRSHVARLDHVLYPICLPIADTGKLRRLYERGIVERVIAARTRHAERVTEADAELAETIKGRDE